MKISAWMTSLGCLLAASALAASGCSDDETTTGATTGTTLATSGGGEGGSTTSGGGDGGASTTSAGGNGGEGGQADPANDCDTYCDLITANCTGDNAQYPSAETCLDVCESEGIPLGTKGTNAAASGENTLGCRIYHGNVPAATEPAVHCTHAGPGGDGQCGDNCESFCLLSGEICGFGTTGNNQYATSEECITACEAFTTEDGDSFDAGDTTDDANGLNCRIYHLTAAATDPGAHCGHTKLDGADPDPCGGAAD